MATQSVLFFTFLALTLLLCLGFCFILRHKTRSHKKRLDVAKRACSLLEDDLRRAASEVQLGVVKPLKKLVDLSVVSEGCSQSPFATKLKKLSFRLEESTRDYAPHALLVRRFENATTAQLDTFRQDACISFEHFGLEHLLDFDLQWHLHTTIYDVVDFAIRDAGAKEVNVRLSISEKGLTLAVRHNGKAPELDNFQYRIADKSENLFAAMRLLRATINVNEDSDDWSSVRLHYPMDLQEAVVLN